MSRRGRDEGRRWTGGPPNRPTGDGGRPAPGTQHPTRPRVAHPIEVESYRRLRELVDLSGLPPLSRAVAERVIHASADLDYASDLVLDEAALAAGREALLGGCELIVDSRMVAAGISARTARVALDGERVAAVAAELGTTRSAAGMLLAAQAAGSTAVYVVGNAPTALFALLEAGVEPPLVIGLPVGFVDAVEAKQALRDAGLASVTNLSAKGGSAVAAAALNALLYADPDTGPDTDPTEPT
jgi:precorrin-8X/cobalt-precorrin-8 methylmutase